MERTDHTALNQRPEAFNSVGVNISMHILTGPVVNGATRKFSINGVIAAPFIRGNETDFVRNSLTDKATQGFSAEVVDDARNYISLALHGADNDGLSVAASAPSVARSSRAS